MKAATTHAERETDVLFDLLSSPRRRAILQILHEHGDDRIDLRKLADLVAARETNKSIDQLTDVERKRVYVSLYQTNVPKLADAGVVHYDVDTRTIEATSRISRFAPYLGWADQPPPLAPAHYLVLAALCGLFFTGSVLNVGVLGSIPAFVAGFIVIVAFAILTVAHSIIDPVTRLQSPADTQSDP